MFATFNSSMSSKTSNSKNGRTTATTTRSRRNQVSRACIWCRTNRIKCDDRMPCKNCADRGRECSKSDTTSRTSSMANKDIDALKAKVSELETQLRERNEASLTPQRSQPSPSPLQPPSAINTTSPITLHAEIADPAPSAVEEEGHDTMWTQTHAEEPWLTTKASAPQVGLTALYSTTHFANRTEAYLAEVLQTSPPLDLSTQSMVSLHLSPHDVDEQWTRLQENYHLDLFWQSYHFLTPIVDNRQFQEYHDSLWSNCSLFDSCDFQRQPSALLDIVLALCTQYSNSFIANHDFDSKDHKEYPSTDGVRLYHRCQAAIASQQEVNSIMVLRCRIYSSVFLLNAGHTDAAYQQLGLAAKIARVRGIRFEQSEGLPQSQRYLLRRIWWTLVVLDTKISLELDRPYLIDISDATVTPPTDDPEEAELSSAGTFTGPSISSYLNYHTQRIQLALLTRAMHAALQAKCTELMAINPTTVIHNDSSSLEACASFLRPFFKRLNLWVNGVPEHLQLSRQGVGRPFSTSKSPLELDIYMPLWLQRQRIHLELLYHNTMASIYHPFIRFTVSMASGTKDHTSPITNGHSTLALYHAATTTNIIHQLLTETELINSWHDIYQFQWGATVTLLAIAVANPVCALVTIAREAILTSIKNFDYFSKHGIIPASTASLLTRETNAKIDILEQKFRNRLSTTTYTPSLGQSGSTSSLSACSPIDPPQQPAQLPLLPHDKFIDVFPALQLPWQAQPITNSLALDMGFEIFGAPEYFAFSSADFPEDVSTQFTMAGFEHSDFEDVQMDLTSANS